MPTRSFKLKLYIPRDDEAPRRQAALSDTHTFFNECVRHYQELLLDFRQGIEIRALRDAAEEGPRKTSRKSPKKTDDVKEATLVVFGPEATSVLVGETSIPGTYYQDRLRGRLADKGLDESAIAAALPLFRQLYEQVVASCRPGKNQSVSGRTIHSPLVDPASKGGEHKDRKEQALRTLIPFLEAPDFETKARHLVTTHEAFHKATGAPPTWFKQFHGGDPKWVESLKKTLKELAQVSEGSVLVQLRTLGALPITPLFGAGKLPKASLSTFERAAFETAIEGMLTWESWGHRTHAEVRKRRMDRDAALRHVEAHAPDALARIRAWEAGRSAQIAARKTALTGAPPTYRLTKRELRGWRDLYEALLSSSDPEKVLKKHGSKSARKKGGAEAVAWLTAPEQRDLLEHPAGNVASMVAELNDLEEKVARARERPRFSYASAEHPRHMKLAKPKDSNSPGYLLQENEGKLSLRLQLLAKDPSGLLVPTSLTYALAPSNQLRELAVVGKGLSVRWKRQDNSGYRVGLLQGGNLMLKGDAAWFKLAVDVSTPDPELAARRTSATTWLNSAHVTRRTTKTEPPWPGFRILSVDLGQRVAATASLFQIGDGGTPWPIDPKANLRLSYLKSVSLALAGERVDADTLEARKVRDADTRRTRSFMWCLRLLRQMHHAEPHERVGLVDDLADAGQRLSDLGLMETSHALRALVEDPTWQEQTARAHALLEEQVRDVLKTWRRNSKNLRGVGGRSMWALEHLERCRRVIRSWRAKLAIGQMAVKRCPEDFPRRLQAHIRHLREDRAKATANLIVQAARGFVYKNNAWVRELPPADMILLEDLSQYQFSTDRPPSKNSKLMQWIHKTIITAVQIQAETEGIAVQTTDASFTSKFDAFTGAPGARCTVLTKADAEALRASEATQDEEGPEQGSWLYRALHKDGVDLKAVKPGDILPLSSGKVFASMRCGKLRIVDADVNASQMLARRYVEGYVSPFRVRLPSLRGEPVVRLSGVRQQGAFGGEVVVWKNNGDPWWTPKVYATEEAYQAAVKDRQKIADVFEEHNFARVDPTLFRDPSQALFNGAWVDFKVFWGRVHQSIASALKERNRTKICPDHSCVG